MVGGSITIGSNLASLKTQRQVQRTSNELSLTFERLSSGMRINRSSDDAAGLAISSKLRNDSRVFNQGVRNVNDAVSMLNIADGALQELSTILIRQRELATQAASGTYAESQRQSLEQEANALVSEYNRIIESTRFNGRDLLTGDQEITRIQAGYGVDGSIAMALGSEISRDVSDGTIGSITEIGGAGFTWGVHAGDLNDDGLTDLVTTGDGDVRAFLSNGNGTFKFAGANPVAGNLWTTVLADVNNDEILDVLSNEHDDGIVAVLIGNGDGTFRARTSFVSASMVLGLEAADFNRDGNMDVVVGNFTDNSVSVLFGNGDGAFTAPQTFATISTARGVDAGDLNGDGAADIVVVQNDGHTQSLLSNGDGTFLAPISLFAGFSGMTTDEVQLSDINNDGTLDLVATSYSGDFMALLIGNGDGTFKALSSFATGDGPQSPQVVDLNEDGNIDLLWVGDGQQEANIRLGNGDGTFRAVATAATPTNPYWLTVGDFSGDGALDLVTANSSAQTFSVMISNTREESRINEFSFATQRESREAIRSIDRALERVRGELGAIGAATSRLTTTVAVLGAMSDNVRAAEGRILDVDVADESSRLVRAQILQQVGSAILAQANQGPTIALRLLSNS